MTRFFPDCGVSKVPQARIVGGNATYEGQYPWMVAIYLHGNGKKEFWCGGQFREEAATLKHYGFIMYIK
jgi:secreted trypsin-like serine protease